MPRTKTDYSKTVIYKIVCNDLEVKDLYVGYTTEFTKRKSSHKKCCNKETDRDYNLKVYKIIRANGGWENWSMIEIEKFSCKDGNEARARERYFYEELEAKMNIQVPNRSRTEFYKQYREEHADELKEYREKHAEENKEYQKKYHEDHREERLQKAREQYIEHREEINRKRRELYAKRRESQ
jgi:hypothetical protein